LREDWVRIYLICFAIATLDVAASAQAQEASRGHLALYGGGFGVLDDDTSAQIGAEYRFAEQFKGLRPTVGVNVDSESAAYVYGGVNWDIPLGSAPFVFTPNFMAGLYHQGAGADLGGAVEFRSGLELSYLLEGDARVGVAFNHISNASLYDKNPGAETLLLVYQHPLALP
jgi:hypothetical protein